MTTPTLCPSTGMPDILKATVYYHFGENKTGGRPPLPEKLLQNLEEREKRRRNNQQNRCPLQILQNVKEAGNSMQTSFCFGGERVTRES